MSRDPVDNLIHALEGLQQKTVFLLARSQHLYLRAVLDSLKYQRLIRRSIGQKYTAH